MSVPGTELHHRQHGPHHKKTAMWLGPSSDPRPEFAEAEPQRWHVGADVNTPWQWNVREHVPVKSMTDSLKRNEHFNVASTELQHFLLSSEGQCELHLDEYRKCVRRTWTKDVRSA